MSHALNYDPSNYKIERDARLLAEMVYAMTRQHGGDLSRYMLTRKSCLRDWSAEEMANILFLESATTMSTFVPLAIFSFYDGACSLEKAARWFGDGRSGLRSPLQLTRWLRAP